MPHEVIMPALGMAQDTGLLVAWLKAPGDAVSAGDPLFEVETDKSTVEVEASSDGFLTGVKADAGSEVPVGQVIALISDTAVEKCAPPAVKVEALQSSVDTPPPAGVDIIMPVLGMAQDSGLLVSWLKKPGDAVGAEDVLFEVETDKSTMEVPAGADGFVAALLAEPGDEVPTGQTIAIISGAKPEAPTMRAVAMAAPPVESPKPVPEPPAKEASAIVSSENGRILISPKARRLAMEAGLDPKRLVAIGRPQPYHVADIEFLRDLPEAEHRPLQQAVAPLQIAACVPRAGTDDFLAWMLEDGDITIARTALWASFAAGALRKTQADARELAIAVSTLAGITTTLIDPDKTRLLHQIENSDATADLILRDLTDSPVTGLRLGLESVPVLSIASDGDTLRLSLDFTGDQLEDSAAIALITGLADRLTAPLLHLL
ncbi:biotin/lipoyl-containing protein [uncultured Roseobacter sp.]|uniref:biotin/lipoyl-containing protein n=1 Tax=uncultured Roseobacter sp. TaxID=114847 RepID=UPI002611EBC7|nr:biotin/lipoyl-containing protein [uncultured Roseobacter sp.]